MYKVKEYIFISFLWFAGAFLLGHSFIPHHHHHSDESVEVCSHQHEHPNFSDAKEEHHHPFQSESDNKNECDECHLEGDFYFNYTKVLPVVFCSKKNYTTYIPKKIDSENSVFIWFNDYAFTFLEHTSYRGPPQLTSSQA